MLRVLKVVGDAISMPTDLNRQPPACVRLVDIARLGAAKKTHAPAVGDRLLIAVALTLVGSAAAIS